MRAMIGREPMYNTLKNLFFLSAFCILFCSQANALVIDRVESSTGYYSVKIDSKFPNNRYELKGLPTAVPYVLTRINNFIKNNLKNDTTATVQFGYSDGQDENHWFTNGSCYIQLPKNEHIVVNIQSATDCVSGLS